MTKEPLPSSQKPDVPQQTRPKRLGGCTIALAIAVVLLGLVACLYPVVVRQLTNRFMQKMYSPAELARIKALPHKPIRVPKEWQNPEPFPQELLKAFDDLNALRAWKNPRLERIADLYKLVETAAHRTISADDWTTAANILHTAQPILERLARLTRHERYDAGLFIWPPGLNGFSGGEMRLRTAGWLLTLQSFQFLHTQAWDDALTSTLTGLELARRHPLSISDTHTYAMMAASFMLEALPVFARECPSTQTLARALEEMNRLDPLVNLEFCTEVEICEIVGALYAMKREGYRVDLAAEKPFYSYMLLFNEAYRRFPQWKLDQLSTSDPHWNLLNDYVASPYIMRSQSWSQKLKERWITPFVPEELFFWAQQFDPEPMAKRYRICKTRYDLTKLLFAQRLLEAEGKTSASLEAFVPRYLPVQPVDPFSGAPYKWDSEGGRFYSIGPDQVDDHAKLLYEDNTKGKDNGDLVVP